MEERRATTNRASPPRRSLGQQAHKWARTALLRRARQRLSSQTVVATTGARTANVSSLQLFSWNPPTLCVCVCVCVCVCCAEDAWVDSPSISLTAEMKCIRGGSLAPSFDRPHTEGHAHCSLVKRVHVILPFRRSFLVHRRNRQRARRKRRTRPIETIKESSCLSWLSGLCWCVCACVRMWHQKGQRCCPQRAL